MSNLCCIVEEGIGGGYALKFVKAKRASPSALAVFMKGTFWILDSCLYLCLYSAVRCDRL